MKYVQIENIAVFGEMMLSKSIIKLAVLAGFSFLSFRSADKLISPLTLSPI